MTSQELVSTRDIPSVEPPVSTRGLARAGFNVLRVSALLAALFSLWAVRGSRSWQEGALTLGVCLAAVALNVRAGRSWRLWVIYAVAFVLFAHLRGYVDEVGFPVHYAYPEAMDAALPGPLPTTGLQNALRDAGGTSPLDYGLTAVYLSYFITPHVALYAVWRWRPTAFVRGVTSVVALFYIGLLVGMILPTAPPWLLSEAGDIGSVDRVIEYTMGDGGKVGNEYGEQVALSNPVAAMPSLHMAIPCLLVFVLAAFHRRWLTVLAATYAGLMGFALVYMGEHWVVDVAAGAVAAAAVWWATGRCWGRNATSPAP